MQRRKIYKLSMFISLLLLLLLFFILVFIKQNNQIKDNAYTYLLNRYDIDIILIKEEQINNKYILTYRTNDKNSITFNVYTYIGKVSTPWGEFPFPERKYDDNFIECINAYIISDDYRKNMSDYDVSEVPGFFIELSNRIKDKYEEYGIRDSTPKFEIEVIYNGKSAIITYTGEDSSIIKDIFVREFLLK